MTNNVVRQTSADLIYDELVSLNNRVEALLDVSKGKLGGILIPTDKGDTLGTDRMVLPSTTFDNYYSVINSINEKINDLTTVIGRVDV